MTDRSSKIFTPGPTNISARVLAAASRQLPYNRTDEFGRMTRDILTGLAALLETAGDVVIFTASGTGAMEAAVTNFIRPGERPLAINGGVFGQRWVDLCRIHGFEPAVLEVAEGTPVDPQALDRALERGRHPVVLATAHETSTGTLSDMQAVGQVARRHGALLVVDAISSVGADAFRMDAWGIDVAILSSQKALALPPGLAFVGIGPRGRERLAEVPRRSAYFHLPDYLENQRRGQMPYTPAIGLFLMLDERLREIRELGNPALVELHRRRAESFRQRIARLPLVPFSKRPSSALTALECPAGVDASELVAELAARHEIYVAPSGGRHKTSLVRVSHLGEQSDTDVDELIEALASVLHSCSSTAN